MVPKLSDTQAVLLAAAAARSDLSVLPAPETLKLKGAALERTLKALLARGLIAEAPTTVRAKMSKWAGGSDSDAGDRRRLIITPAGLEATGVEKRGPAPASLMRFRSSVHTPSPNARDPGASWVSCWMRSRVRRGRRSKI